MDDRPARLFVFLDDRLDFFDDALRGASRIGGGNDGPAHHQIARSRPHRFAGSHRAGLIVFLGTGRGASDARRDDGEVRPAGGSDRGRFLRRGHDAIEPCLPAPCAPAHDLIEERTLDADGAQRVLVHAGQDGHGDHERLRSAESRRGRLSRPSRAACIIGTPPEAWTLIIHAPVVTAAATACATVFGNVVKLQIEEDAVALRRQGAERARDLRREQAAADLEAADQAAERRRELERASAPDSTSSATRS